MSMSPFAASRLYRVESVLRDLYSITESKPSAGSKGHHEDPETGKAVHSTGKKENKKFANNTTFKPSDTDAMLHTDGSKTGVRATANKSDFAVQGREVDSDPTDKYFRTKTSDGGAAAAAGSLRQAYAHPKDLRKKVIDKVKNTQFTGTDGQSFTIKPTGALHNERPHCGEGSKGQAHPFQGADPDEHARLCKGPHGVGGGPEHKTSFHSKDPKREHAPGWVKRSHLDATGISGIDDARHKAKTGHSAFTRDRDTGKIDLKRSSDARIQRHHGVQKPVTKMIDTAHRTKFRLSR